MLSATDKLLALEEIRQLKARYFRFVDSHDWSEFRSLFTDDAVFTLPKAPQSAFGTELVSGGEDVIEGADAFVAWVSQGLADAKSAHLGYMPEIEILSATEARGLWGMEDIVRWPGRTIHGYGYYSETYRCEDDAWRISGWALSYKSMEAVDLGASNTRVV